MHGDKILQSCTELVLLWVVVMRSTKVIQRLMSVLLWYEQLFLDSIQWALDLQSVHTIWAEFHSHKTLFFPELHIQDDFCHRKE